MNSEKKGALSGVRVLDLSRVLAGPYCTMFLGDMGAEVIKVELPDRGDDVRLAPPYQDGVSAYFANLNRNKESLALDLKQNKGKQVLTDLIRSCDVLIENFKPGVMDRLGFSYEAVSGINPRIIYASVSSFGQYGPYKDGPGMDIIAQAMSGMMSVTGWPDSPPTRSGTAVGDILAGLNVCVGILAALRSRDVTGKGQQVDVALVDCSISCMEAILLINMVEGRIPQRNGNRYEFMYPYDSFRAKDGWIVMAAGTDQGWKRLCELIDVDPMQEGCTNLVERVQNWQKINEMVTAWTAQHTVDENVKIMTNVGIPCGPIFGVEQVVKDPHFAARGMFPEMDHPLGKGKIKTVGNPIKFSETPVSIRRTAPRLGQHSESVLKDKLGYSDQQCQELLEAGVVKGEK